MVVDITTNDTYEMEIKIAVQLKFTMKFLHKIPTIVLIYEYHCIHTETTLHISALKRRSSGST